MSNSRVAIIGDMHFGVKGGAQYFLDFQLSWLEESLKRIQMIGIDTVIQTGDMFDVRKYIAGNVLHAALFKIPDLFKKYGIKKVIIYAGNHDTFLRESNEICTLNIYKLFPDLFHIITDDVEVLSFYGKKLAFVPWMNKNNQDRLIKAIPKADYLFGHFEFIGMPMVAGGAKCEHGLEVAKFKDFKRVISGHFHTVSTHMNVTMVGTPYHLNWNDVLDGDNRGFWVLDVDNDQFELMRNYDFMTLFSVIEYDPNQKYDDKYFQPYRGNIVKVVIKENGDAKHMKNFNDLLKGADMIDYSIINNTITKIENVKISEEVLSMDTMKAMSVYIDGIENDDVDVAEIKKLANSIYMEVLNGGA